MKVWLVLVATACAPAMGQQMYRCGNTFSQSPCGADAVTIKTEGVPQPSGPPDLEKVAKMQEECRSWVTTVPAWKDRDSLKFKRITRGRPEAHKGTMARAYYATVNAKNSMGAYAGEQIAVCYVNLAETKVLDVVVHGPLQ